jgi:hypothetical protein
MNMLLVSLALALPSFQFVAAQPSKDRTDDKRPVTKLDGDWTITYAEMDGKKIEGKAFTHVTIKDNVVTCTHDGKERQWKLQFGPHHMVRCTELIDGKVTATDKGATTDKAHHSHHGVYIASQEFFCLCMEKGRDHRTFGEGGTGGRFDEHQGAHSAPFVLILHRGSTPFTGAR